MSVWCTLVTYKTKEPTRFLGCRWGYGDTRFPPAIEPNVVVTDYAGRCVDRDSKAPLAHQAPTDVYMAVVRRPDPPTLVMEDERIVLHPGYNHRETGEYHLYLNGRLWTKLPVNDDDKSLSSNRPTDGYDRLENRSRKGLGTGSEPAVLPEGGTLTARAVEWSGLKSPDSNAVAVKPGTPVVPAPEPVGQPSATVPEVTDLEGGGHRRQYRSPKGWPCQVLEYRADGTLHRRKLFRASDEIFSVEEYDASGRRTKETIYNREGRKSEWTRFEKGTAVERWHLRYGLFPAQKKMEEGRWVKVRP